MASNGIRDRVAIVGMGCTPFGEHWDKSASDLLVDSATEAYRSAQVARGNQSECFRRGHVPPSVQPAIRVYRG